MFLSLKALYVVKPWLCGPPTTTNPCIKCCIIIYTICQYSLRLSCTSTVFKTATFWTRRKGVLGASSPVVVIISEIILIYSRNNSKPAKQIKASLIWTLEHTERLWMSIIIHYDLKVYDHIMYKERQFVVIVFVIIYFLL